MAKINSRDKGQRGEREIVNLCKKHGIIVSRNLLQTRNGGYDLITDGSILESYAIEIKTLGSWSNGIRKKHWEQAKRQAVEKNKIPILVWRLNRCVWFIEYYIKSKIVIEYLDVWLASVCKTK